MTDTKTPALDDRPPVSGRTVEITDEDESVVIAFIPADPKTSRNR